MGRAALQVKPLSVAESKECPRGSSTGTRTGCRDERLAGCGMSVLVGKQTRPDLQFCMSAAQRHQNNPSVGNVKATNQLVDQAKQYREEGIVLRKISEEDMIVLAFRLG